MRSGLNWKIKEEYYSQIKKKKKDYTVNYLSPAIREGNTFSIIDGKQRLTTILKIVNNEIPLEKRYASEKIKILFTNWTIRHCL